MTLDDVMMTPIPIQIGPEYSLPNELLGMPRAAIRMMPKTMTQQPRSRITTPGRVDDEKLMSSRGRLLKRRVSIAGSSEAE